MQHMKATTAKSCFISGLIAKLLMIAAAEINPQRRFHSSGQSQLYDFYALSCGQLNASISGEGNLVDMETSTILFPLVRTQSC